MTKFEFAIVVILRLVGIGALFAIPAIFLPYAWMDAIHSYMGLGKLPDAPIVHYLARSLSAFYAVFGAITVFISCDVRRYRLLVAFWAILVSVMGGSLLGIDLSAGMPTSWTLSEGPPTIAIGIVVWWLQRRAFEQSDRDSGQPRSCTPNVKSAI